MTKTVLCPEWQITHRTASTSSDNGLVPNRHKTNYLSETMTIMFTEACIHHSAPTSVPIPLQWRHNGRDGVSNQRRLDCLLNRLFRRRSKKTSKFCVTGLYEGNPLVSGGFPSQRTSNAKNVSNRWRHHDTSQTHRLSFQGVITHINIPPTLH